MENIIIYNKILNFERILGHVFSKMKRNHAHENFQFFLSDMLTLFENLIRDNTNRV